MARAMVWAAAIISAPRYAGAFLSADVVTIEPWLSNALHWANMSSGLAMGLLEAFASAYILDGLSRIPPKSTRVVRVKNGTERVERREAWSFRWVGTLLFAVFLLGLSFAILSPFMVARMEGVGMAEYFGTRGGRQGWTYAILAAPILIIGGVSFSQRFMATVATGSDKPGTNVAHKPAFTRGLSGFVEYQAWLKSEGLQFPGKEQAARDMGRDPRSIERYIAALNSDDEGIEK